MGIEHNELTSRITRNIYCYCCYCLNVIQAKLTSKQCWSAVSPAILGVARCLQQGHLVTYICSCLLAVLRKGLLQQLDVCVPFCALVFACLLFLLVQRLLFEPTIVWLLVWTGRIRYHIPFCTPSRLFLHHPLLWQTWRHSHVQQFPPQLLLLVSMIPL